jgi:hypothetical protein
VYPNVIDSVVVAQVFPAIVRVNVALSYVVPPETSQAGFS